MKQTLIVILCALLAGALIGCAFGKKPPEKRHIGVLILPKFEIGEMSGDYPGESLDIFETSMKNNFKVGKVVIDAILNGKL